MCKVDFYFLDLHKQASRHSGGMEISLKAGASLSSAWLQSFYYDSAAAAGGEHDRQRDDSREGFIQEKKWKWRDKLQ